MKIYINIKQNLFYGYMQQSDFPDFMQNRNR